MASCRLLQEGKPQIGRRNVGMKNVERGRRQNVFVLFCSISTVKGTVWAAENVMKESCCNVGRIFFL